MQKKLLFFSISIFIFSCTATKLIPVNEDQLHSNLKQHISTLASDAFEGRETGTAGEKLSYEYIEKEFSKRKLKGKGEKGFLQEFNFTDGTKNGPGTQLIINSTIYKTDSDFFALPYSANGSVTGYITKVGFGITDTALKQDDYRHKSNINKKIFLIESGTPDGHDPHGKFGEWSDLRKKIDLAITHGATGIIFINTDTAGENPSPDWNNRITPSAIPVLFAKKNVAQVLKDSVITNCTIGAEIIKIEKQGHNVIGYIDNKSGNTIVIGAHYDHLGYGGEGSLYRGAPAIHNGADDNASGVAALIEIADYVKKSELKKNNYMFIAFSGEEKGLLGSNYFVKHPTVDIKKINYMINMDMVGRLKPDEKTLIINGTGTSDTWQQVIDSANTTKLKLKETESGVGPSDHTSFYLQNIPVLHFFSGSHSDYHKPGDDEDKINYAGEIEIVHMIENILTNADSKGKLVFKKTKDDDNEDAPKFKVTLGVVPDYAFDGAGMRIDGVTDGRPASKAQLQPGDVVIQLGENKVVDMMSYMKALGKFNKGDTTKVKVMRGKEEIVRDVTF